MRIKHIYITKEGEPMANPEMEYPENPKDKEPVPKIQKIWKHGEDLEKYHSGLLPFEYKENAKIYGPPDTLIPVDLEVEVLVQYRMQLDGPWIVGQNQTGAFLRKVLRIL